MAASPRPLAADFADLRDPRIALKCEHDFMAVILIVVCATLAGADDFVGMATFARAKRTWFRERLGLNRTYPANDVIDRWCSFEGSPDPLEVTPCPSASVRNGPRGCSGSTRTRPRWPRPAGSKASAPRPSTCGRGDSPPFRPHPPSSRS